METPRSLGVYAWDSQPVKQEREAFCMNLSLHAGFKGGGISFIGLMRRDLLNHKGQIFHVCVGPGIPQALLPLIWVSKDLVLIESLIN